MLKKIIPVIAGIIILILVLALIAINPSGNRLSQNVVTSSNASYATNNTNDTLIEIPWDKSLFKILAYKKDITTVNGYTVSTTQQFAFKPQYVNLYKTLQAGQQNTIVIIPTFTQSAYNDGGFYDYYKGKCNTKCLTVKIDHGMPSKLQSSQNAVKILSMLNYSFITDIDVDKDPGMLSKYDKVILLHSEYVTKKEFDAITHHTNVVYLYPNSLFANVTANYPNDTITLIRGHGYPNSTIQNGFGWKFDNTVYEKDVYCNNWNFYPVDNGYMMSCYPEHAIYQNATLLMAIKLMP